MDRPINNPYLKFTAASLILLSNGALAWYLPEHNGAIEGLLYDSRWLTANGMSPLAAMKLQKAWMTAIKWTLQHPYSRVLYSFLLACGLIGDSVLLLLPWLLTSFVETAAQLMIVLSSIWILLFFLEPMTVPIVLSVMLQLILIQIYSGFWTLIALWTFQSAIEEMVEVLAVSRGPTLLLTYDPDTQRMSARELNPRRPGSMFAVDPTQEQPRADTPWGRRPLEPPAEETDSLGSHETGESDAGKGTSEGITRGPEIEKSPEISEYSSLAESLEKNSSVKEHSEEDKKCTTSAADVEPDTITKQKSSETKPIRETCPKEKCCKLIRDGKIPKSMTEPQVQEGPENDEEVREEHVVAEMTFEESAESADASRNVVNAISDHSEANAEKDVGRDNANTRKKCPGGERDIFFEAEIDKEYFETSSSNWHYHESHTRKEEPTDVTVVGSKTSEYSTGVASGNVSMDPVVYEEDDKECWYATSTIAVSTSDTEEENIEGGDNTSPYVVAWMQNKPDEYFECEEPFAKHQWADASGEDRKEHAERTMREEEKEILNVAQECEDQLCEKDSLSQCMRGSQYTIGYSSQDATKHCGALWWTGTAEEGKGGSDAISDDNISYNAMAVRMEHGEEVRWSIDNTDREIEGMEVYSTLCFEMGGRGMVDNTTSSFIEHCDVNEVNDAGPRDSDVSTLHTAQVRTGEYAGNKEAYGSGENTWFDPTDDWVCPPEGFLK